MDTGRKGKSGNVMKVVELGVQDKVYNAMKKLPFSVEALTRQLNAEGISITAQSIRKFIKNTKEAQKELIQNDMQAANELKKVTMDYTRALRDILTEVEEVKNDAKNDKDYTTYNQLIGRLMQGIELVGKMTGDLKPSNSVDINIIYNEIHEGVENELKNVTDMFSKNNIIDIEKEVNFETDTYAKEMQGEDK